MSVLSPEKIIQAGGIALIGGVVFAESGLAIGFFLPGDTLLFAAGFFSAQGQLPNLGWIIAVIVVAAVAGDNVGYTIGRRFGPRLFKKQDGIFFKQSHVTKAEEFYENHGGKTIILARFVPVVRTFAPMVAGVSKMPRKNFFMFNVIGALLWGGGVTTAGYFLGSKIPNIDTYILPIVAFAMFCTFAPTVVHILREPRARALIVHKLRSIFLLSR